MVNNSETLQPQEMTATTSVHKDGAWIGIVSNYEDSDETRSFLTPEACGMVHSMGYNIRMQKGAAIDINYDDENYAEVGVEISSRQEALQSDIVLSVRPLKPKDIKKMKKGAALLTMMDSQLFDKATIKALLDKSIACVCLDKVLSHNGVQIFAEIIDEIDGRAAMMYAQEGLSFLGGGKGVLLSGIAGVNPCEVLIIGTGRKVYAASKAAMALGAKVTLMDNDVSSLLEAQEICGSNLSTSAIHPHVLFNKVKSADVIILDLCTRHFEFPKQLSIAMKDSVYLIDLTDTIPSLSVPRTVAMAISNIMINFLNETILKGGINQQIATTFGVQQGVITFNGKLVDKILAIHHGIPQIDISMMSSGVN